jgi:hypothetical protein
MDSLRDDTAFQNNEPTATTVATAIRLDTRIPDSLRCRVAR